jgi:hypothetical protein
LALGPWPKASVSERIFRGYSELSLRNIKRKTAFGPSVTRALSTGQIDLELAKGAKRAKNGQCVVQKSIGPGFGTATDRSGVMAPAEPIKSDQKTWRRAERLTSGYLASFLPLRYLLALSFWLLNAK